MAVKKRKEMDEETTTTTTTTTQGTLDSWLGITPQKEDDQTIDGADKAKKKVKTAKKDEDDENNQEEEEEEKEDNHNEDDDDNDLDDDSKIKKYLTFDLKSIQNSKDYFEQVMKPLALSLMNKTMIVAGSKHYRISEMEYYINGHAHKDTFTHGDIQQLDHAMWYFHRQNGGAYKSGSYKGLDIAFGDSVCYCGILIRGIEEVDASTGKPVAGASALVDGPSLTVDRLLASAGYATIDDLIKANGRSLLPSQNKVLYLLPTDKFEATKNIITTGRVGLTMKMNRAGGHRYFAREYRFVRLPDKIKKGKHYMNVALHRQGKKASEINKITGSTLKSIQTLIDAFDKGTKLTKKDIEKLKDISKSEDCCTLLGLCSNLDKLEEDNEQQATADDHNDGVNNEDDGEEQDDE